MVCLPLWSARRDPGRLQNVLGARSISKNAGNEVLPPVRKRILILFGLKKRLRTHFQRFLRALAAVYCGQGAKAPPTALRSASHHLPSEKRNMQQRPHSNSPHVSANLWSECETARKSPFGDDLANALYKHTFYQSLVTGSKTLSCGNLSHPIYNVSKASEKSVRSSNLLSSVSGVFSARLSLCPL